MYPFPTPSERTEAMQLQTALGHACVQGNKRRTVLGKLPLSWDTWTVFFILPTLSYPEHKYDISWIVKKREKQANTWRMIEKTVENSSSYSLHTTSLVGKTNPYLFKLCWVFWCMCPNVALNDARHEITDLWEQIYLIVYLSERQTHRKETPWERSFTLWFSLQMPATARARPGAPSESPPWAAGPQVLGPSSLVFPHISRNLD